MLRMSIGSSIERRGDERRQNPHRHRRLDLSAVARSLLSRQAAAIEGARICLAPARRDRDQRHLLRPAEARRAGRPGRKRSPDGFQFAIKGSRYLRDAARSFAKAREGIGNFFAQGFAALGPKLGPDPVAIRRRAANSTATTSPASSTCFRRSSTASRCATRSSRATRASATRTSSSSAAPATSRSCSKIRTNIRCIEADTADFAYARLQRMSEDVPTGYDDAALDGFAEARPRVADERPRRLHLHDQRRESARAGGRAGAAGTASLSSGHAHRRPADPHQPVRAGRPHGQGDRHGRRRRSAASRSTRTTATCWSISPRPTRSSRASTARSPRAFRSSSAPPASTSRGTSGIAAGGEADCRPRSAPNTSLGIALLARPRRARGARARTRLGHRDRSKRITGMKADAPSGTALTARPGGGARARRRRSKPSA